MKHISVKFVTRLITEELKIDLRDQVRNVPEFLFKVVTGDEPCEVKQVNGKQQMVAAQKFGAGVIHVDLFL